MEIKQNVPLAEYTSWMVGGPAEFFCLPETLEDVKEGVRWAQARGVALTYFGGGTNILVSDKGLSGLVMCLRKFSGTDVSENNGRLEITALAGTGKSELLKLFLKHKLAPALFLAGLPGDVGGGIAMNAGVGEAFVPREFVEITDWVEVLRFDGDEPKVVRFAKEDLHWEYRHTSGWQPGIVVRVGISWPLTPDLTILDQVKAANKSRLTKQPLEMPSCGSVFRNPPGHKAAQLIDSCGLKGHTIGEAQVSVKHANFIVNLGDAKAKDILALIEHVKATVKAQKNVELQTEVVRFGDFV
jgi:UDP-N-acetylmuramate dehydrogenase